MTTEVAVANQLGIALATDSAVTITSGGKVKVFDTADKLFELSESHPIGVMINGAMDCLGVPWEIMVKDFRDKEGRSSRPTVQQWAKDFLDYVETHVLISETIVGGYIDHVTHAEVDAVQHRVGVRLQEFMFADTNDKGPKRNRFDIRAVLARTIQERKVFLERFPIASSLKDLVRESVRETYSAKIKDIMERRFVGQKLTPEEISSLTDLIIESLLRAVPSEMAAGIVVAGYGADETFPSVVSAEVDGRVSGKLKILDTKASVISSGQDGQVTHFAQTDVIERLLKGVDPRFVSNSAEFIERAVTEVAETMEKATRRKRMSRKKIDERLNLIRDIAEAVAEEYRSKTAETLKNGFSREFDRMIAMMPKQEVIELAEALVSITAVERKATSDEGTVGGPIDVAFITKHEGFVWIKRKHYFDRDLNPRYFWRKYGSPPQRSAE